MSKRAVILAGGKGTRLRPYTLVLPKPLMPVGEYPILEVIIRQLAQAGFKHITLAVNHQAELIKAFFQDGGRWGVKIDYSLEDQPLGTMGPLKLIADLPEHFLVMNGDILTDLNFASFYERHLLRGDILSISATKRHQRIDYGVLEISENHRLVGFHEKPQTTYRVSMGIYMLSNAVLAHIPTERAYGFDNLVLDLLAASKPLYVDQFDGYWLDIGRPDDYATAIDVLERDNNKFLPEV